jgi:hypothetical protein
MSELAISMYGIALVFAGLGIIALHFRINSVESASEARWRHANEWMRIQEEINKENDL